MKSSFKRVKLHSQTIRAIKNGHPWVTQDKFTKSFPKNEKFLIGLDSRQKEFVVLINDPNHDKIKARVWELYEKNKIDFKFELQSRIEKAIVIREQYLSERDNVYLVFGEADGLPGISILKLGKVILCQYYSDFWSNYDDLILKILKDQKIVGVTSYFKQVRNKKKEVIYKKLSGVDFENNSLFVGEFGLKYELHFSDCYDFGLYTDMASIRKKLIPLIEKKSNMLNLYSYTGAFSLLAMNFGVNKVTSVDLSFRYLNWLERNIKLNNLNDNNHISINKPVEKALLKLEKDNEKFDLIICDPPSSSSDGKKISSVLKGYERDFIKMCDLLEDRGHLILFLNTHKTSKKIFNDKILDLLRVHKLTKSVKILKHFTLGDDCITFKGFPEGDYLKGILLEKNEIY